MPTRTITLSDRPPVQIDEDTWPEIASASDDDATGASAAQRKASIRVRRHADGRCLVYGVATDSRPNARNLRAGYLVDANGYPERVVAAIQRVAETLGWPALAADTIASLPAEPLL
jgi:hypothetical protein